MSENCDAVPAEIWLRQPDAVAALTPSEGFCCTAFRVRLAGEWRSILVEPPSWSALQARPAFYGNPLLCPYPYDVADGTFVYRGERYMLRPGRTGRTAHGFVRDHRWTVERTWDDADGAHVRASITNQGSNELLAEFPFPFCLTVTYTLRGMHLKLAAQVVNLGGGCLPFGFGIHPYFPISHGPQGQIADIRLLSNVDTIARLGPHNASVTFARPPGALDLRVGLQVADLLYQRSQEPLAGLREIYTDLAEPSVDPLAGVRCTLTDPGRRMSISIATSVGFRTLYLFTPRDATVVSPVISTCLPNAFNLASSGWPSGLIELAAGATWTGSTTIGVSGLVV